VLGTAGKTGRVDQTMIKAHPFHHHNPLK